MWSKLIVVYVLENGMITLPPKEYFVINNSGSVRAIPLYMHFIDQLNLLPRILPRVDMLLGYS
jgi:hypothetical protein